MVTRIVAAAAAVLLAGSAQAWSFGAIEGNGEKITERRDVPPFDRISVGGAIDAVVKVGPAQSVAITIDSNLAPHVRTRVENGQLVVDTDENLSWKGGARAEITVPRLRALSTSGSSDATIEGGSGEDLELSTSGSGDIRWRGEAKAMEISTSGSGDVTLAGRADTVEISTSGSGDVKGEEFTTRDAQ
ncbi:MAG TPA: head GIN domain-containing protein, partial [Anaeromyxobacteraceae bacterium]|nr:head GIN domain-containing protein [Anaeromyxobacteraceae bacterium]